MGTTVVVPVPGRKTPATLRAWSDGCVSPRNDDVRACADRGGVDAVVVATLAGLLVSVLPARRAARTAPVAAIAG